VANLLPEDGCQVGRALTLQYRRPVQGKLWWR